MDAANYLAGLFDINTFSKSQSIKCESVLKNIKAAESDNSLALENEERPNELKKRKYIYQKRFIQKPEPRSCNPTCRLLIENENCNEHFSKKITGRTNKSFFHSSTRKYARFNILFFCRMELTEWSLLPQNRRYLPRMYDSEILQLAQNNYLSQCFDKKSQRTRLRLECRGLNEPVGNWVATCVMCQQAEPR